ncbi:MAG: L-fucose/L-arabinose isomerase family protein [Candidatus Bipolaricaulota bacterium]|nr:MAG: L-fucose/L-arabinose isomerase family protein [Candidatus Bipolaricaulota bacterium]
MDPRKVGILTFSDGRASVHRDLEGLNRTYQRQLADALRATGEVEPIEAEEIVWTNELAKAEADRLANAGCELTIFNFAVWSFPHLAAIASRFAPGPYLLFSNINPEYPGMVGMLASAGALDQIGAFHGRVSGDISDAAVLDRVMSFIRGASAVRRLRGETFGLFGGRPMGMYTAVANADQWMDLFGIDVEHIDQSEIIRRSAEASEEEVDRAFEWLSAKVGKIRYDDKQLTPEKLKTQIRSYIAARQMIEEMRLDFVGFKAQPELTDHFVTMDVTEAFLNDPYDWNGPKEPIVAATEADMDGALTMEILKHISSEPVLFADLRHYDAELGLFDLCNSGTHPTYFAGRSTDPDVNLPRVEFYPQGFYFPAGGASVRHFAASGEVTLARLARRRGKYWLAILPAEFVELPKDRAEQKAEEVQIDWPHAYARFRVPPEVFLAEYDSNHIHGAYGSWVDELVWAAKTLGIDYRIFDDG